jgi:hypothetical protein
VEWIIKNETIKLSSSQLPEWIPAQPAAKTRAVRPVFIQQQVGGVARALGGEAEGVQGRRGAGEANGLRERAMFIPGGFSATGGTDKSNYVPVSVVRGKCVPIGDWKLQTHDKPPTPLAPPIVPGRSRPKREEMPVPAIVEKDFIPTAIDHCETVPNPQVLCNQT